MGRNKQKFVEMVTPSKWTMKVMNDQFPVLPCDIVFYLSLRPLQVFDLNPTPTHCRSLSSVQECSLWVYLKTNPPSQRHLSSVLEKHVRWIQRTHSHLETWYSVVLKLVNKPLASFFHSILRSWGNSLWQTSYNKQILQCTESSCHTFL
jgi:hypothetical protein